MGSLSDRLASVVAPRYRVLDEIGSGGMSRVFRAEDTTLDRRVAIKVLRPELATAVGSERFLREARALAAVSHPNIVAIHECDSAGGLQYYVMDFVDAPTLRERLHEEGALPRDEAVRLGADLLAALSATHASGRVHRDVKPGNIFVCSDRVLLADFGISKELTGSETTVTEADSPGTPAYMSPEQLAGDEATVRSDLYSAAMSIYEALTGRRWVPYQAPAQASWSGVPHRLRAVLSRALDPDPARRWSDAEAFSRAYRRRTGHRSVGLRAAVLLLGALSMYLVWQVWPRPLPPRTADLAVLPCSSPGVDPAVARYARSYATTQLDALRDVRVLSERQTLSSWERYREALQSEDWAGWSEALGAEWVTECRISETNGAWLVAARLHAGSESEGPSRQSVSSGDTIGAGQALFHVVLEGLGSTGLTRVSSDEAGVLREYSADAVLSFLEGKQSFREDALRDAVVQFSQSLALEPDFALAEWHLAEAQRWLAHAAVEVDLEELHRTGSTKLPVRDSVLLAARIAPYEDKLTRLREAAVRFPEEAYPTLLHADEMYHRGGLWGEPIDSAVALFAVAVRKDSTLAPAVEHLSQALIRLGYEEPSARSLELLKTVSGQPDQHDVDYCTVWNQAHRERFADPVEARAGFGELVSGFGPPGSPEWVSNTLEFLRIGCRWVRYVELPASQEMLGHRLVALAREIRSPDDVAHGMLAIALGRLGQGRVREAIPAFDTIATLTGELEARLQAAEWRVLPPAVGLEGFSPTAADSGVAELHGIWRAPVAVTSQRRRAAFGIAAYELRAGTETGTSSWKDSLAKIDESLEMRPAWNAIALLETLELRGRDEVDQALQRTEALVRYDSLALERYPFSRAVSYWLRAGLQAAAGDTADALRTLYWHENTDLEEGTAPGIAQAAEIDAAFGVHARIRSIELASGLATDAGGAGLPICDLVRSRGREVMRLWQNPDPVLQPLIARVARHLESNQRRCPR
ncbi:MAG: serine/threonine protein kinase [marine benthic group bacterium]|nr:serine/threonine protein kinase [Candidatus Carthagonibacter metallireducens]